MQNQQDKYAISVLTELRRLILLDIDEHGQEYHDHSVELLRHIERTLEEIEEAKEERRDG